MKYLVTKHYGHSFGLSCTFRQHKAESHCKYLHGYALAVSVTFGSNVLNLQNWVVDFGSLHWVKEMLRETFDHKLIVAKDDPELDLFMELDKRRVASVSIMETVSCEAFAEYILNSVAYMLGSTMYGKVTVLSVTVSEHDGNSATVNAT